MRECTSKQRIVEDASNLLRMFALKAIADLKKRQHSYRIRIHSETCETFPRDFSQGAMPLGA